MSAYCLKLLAAISLLVIQTQRKEKYPIKDLGLGTRCYVKVSKKCDLNSIMSNFTVTLSYYPTLNSRDENSYLSECAPRG